MQAKIKPGSVEHFKGIRDWIGEKTFHIKQVSAQNFANFIPLGKGSSLMEDNFISVKTLLACLEGQSNTVRAKFCISFGARDSERPRIAVV